MSLFRPNVATPTGQTIVRIGLVLLAVIFLAGGSIASYHIALKPLYDAWRTRYWQAVEAVLDEVELTAGAAGGNQGAMLRVTYRYRFAGLTHEGHRFGLHTWIDNADAQKEAYANLLYTQTLRAWVNPKNPAESILNRELHPSAMLMAIPALAIALLGFTLLRAALTAGLATLRAKRRHSHRV